MADTTRVAVVTGAGGAGCGRAIALRLAQDGASVILADVDEVGGQETLQQIQSRSGRASFVRADVRSDAQVRDLVAFAETTFGGIDVLVNNASAARGDERIDTWTEAIETDLLGALHTTRWAIEAMRRRGGGAIVNIASISALWHGRRTAGGFPGYDVAKAGVIRMTTRLAPLKSERIRVNCLAPGWIATPEVQAHWDALSAEDRLILGAPSRLVTPAQIADAVVQLADDPSLAGRVLVWWPEDAPRLIEWADRGYRTLTEF